MRRLKSLLILALFAACISSRARIARAQAAATPVPAGELREIFGALAFDSIGQSQGGIPTEVRWVAADTFTFRLLHPHAINRGLHLEILNGAPPQCSWSTRAAARDSSSIPGLLFKVSTRVDSAGNLLAEARMGCRGVALSGAPSGRDSFSTGIVVQLVKTAGKWRIAKVVDHWIT
jgi:hypothetical protein